MACLVLGCAWNLYANVFGASVYPSMSSGNFDAPVIRRPPQAVAARIPQTVINNVFAALPDPALLRGKLLYLAEALPGAQPYLKDRFARAEKIAEVKRMRGPLVIETYAIDLLEGAKGEVLDNSPPPELQ